MTFFLIGLLFGLFFGLFIMGMAWWHKCQEIKELEALLGTPIKKLVEGRRR